MAEMAMEPPFEYSMSRVILDVLFEMNAKMADIREHLVYFRRLVEGDDGREEAGPD
jgi:hypothetical protein